MAGKIIKVLVIDDSALVRKILEKAINKDPRLKVVGTAADVYQGRDMIVKYRPDVLTLDIEMPRMDGVEFLKRLMPQYPLPVVVVSSLTQKGKQVTLDALDSGAVDYVAKPKANIGEGLSALTKQLQTKIKLAATADVSHWKHKRFEKTARRSKTTGVLKETTDKMLVIGASTGGTSAIRAIISALPASMPGTVIVQHMPAGFTKMFADRLNQISRMSVKEAVDGDRIMTGRCLVAPGGKHMSVFRSGGLYKVSCKEGELVNGHCPSVDVIMKSVAKYVGKNAVGLMLTGMGKDGAAGMLEMKIAGAYNVGQDEKSSVVYGMPKVAYDIGAVDRQLPLEKIPDALVSLFR